MYKDWLNCFTWGSTENLAKKCNKRNNIYCMQCINSKKIFSFFPWFENKYWEQCSPFQTKFVFEKSPSNNTLHKWIFMSTFSFLVFLNLILFLIFHTLHHSRFSSYYFTIFSDYESWTSMSTQCFSWLFLIFNKSCICYLKSSIFSLVAAIFGLIILKSGSLISNLRSIWFFD